MIYLDNAATSYPKPAAVLDAMRSYLDAGGNPGRSGHRLARAAEEMVWDARLVLAGLLGVEEPERVVFTGNATMALNIAIKGLVQSGDRVLTSSFEHNSVMRPLYALEDSGVVTTVIPPGTDCAVDLDRLESELRANRVRLVVMSHASNVTGACVPLAQVHELTTRYGALLVVDAAQTAGHTAVRGDDAEVVVFAGHKGLHGPQGTGGMYVSERVTIRPLLHGGTGGRSEVPHQPRWLPYALESGTPNGVGIAGLAAGVRHVSAEGLDAVRIREADLRRALVAAVARIPGVQLHEWPSPVPPMPVVSVTFDRLSATDAAALLDERHGIMVRGGLHCAPMAHRTLGTAARGGTVRLAPSHCTTPSEIEAAVAGIVDVAALSTAAAMREA